MFSRGSTIGKLVDGKRVGSALYFYDFGLSKSPTLGAERIAKLRTPTNNTKKPYEAIKRRDRWMDHLASNRHGVDDSEESKQDIFRWATETRVDPEVSEMWLRNQARKSVYDVP